MVEIHTFQSQINNITLLIIKCSYSYDITLFRAGSNSLGKQSRNHVFFKTHVIFLHRAREILA